MNFLKQHTGGILLCLFEVIVGILLLINPIAFTAGIIIAFGVILILLGLIWVIGYFRQDAVEAAVNQSLVKGLVALIFGGFCAFKGEWFLSAFPLITMLYGIAVLIAGLMKIEWTVDAIRLKNGKWYLPALSAVLSLACAVIILKNPGATMLFLWVFTGVSLIVEAIFDVAALIFCKVHSGD